MCFEHGIAGSAIVFFFLNLKIVFLDHLDALTQDCIVHSGKRFQLCVKDKFIWK